ncbi:hypothetical protein GCM10020227_64320 [Streptomyces flavovirens]
MAIAVRTCWETGAAGRVTMTSIEPGLYVHNGFAEGPLADAALSRAARGAQLSTTSRSRHPR